MFYTLTTVKKQKNNKPFTHRESERYYQLMLLLSGKDEQTFSLDRKGLYFDKELVKWDKVEMVFNKLEKDGKNVKGFGGCNSFMGTYEVNENKIKFGPMAGTRKFCEKTMELENSFMKVFSEVNNYKIFGEKLELYRDENVIAKFESVYFQ